MRYILDSFLLIIFLNAATLPVIANDFELAGTGKVSFHGSATVHKIHGDLETETFKANVHRDETGKITRLTFNPAVQVIKMNTGNKKRDKEMYHSFQEPEYPLIRGKVVNFDTSNLTPDSSAVPMAMELTIRDISKNVNGTISHWQSSEKSISFEYDFDVSNSDFNLKFPSILFVKVKDTVHVHVAFQMEMSA